MQKTATLSVRVDPEVKKSAESILGQLGLSTSTAVDMFLRQVVLKGGIPFDVTLPMCPRTVDADSMSDAELGKVFSRGLREAESGANVPASDAFDSLRKELFDA